MIAYWFVGYLLFFGAILESFLQGQNNGYNRFFISFLFFVSVVFLIFFGGIRGLGTGLDDFQYINYYSEFVQKSANKSFADNISNFRYEPTIFIISYIVSFFSQDSSIFLLVYCAISVSINAYTYKKYSPLYVLSLAIYSVHLFINKDMNQIRFGLGSALFVLSVCFIAEKKYNKSLLLIFLSFLTHSTTIAAVLIIPFVFIRKNRNIPILIILLALPLGLIGSKVLFVSYLPTLPFIGEKVSSYLGTDFDGDLAILSMANFKNILFVLAFSIFVLPGLKGKDYLFGYYIILVYAIGGAIRMIFSDFSIIGGRVGNLFLHVEPLLIALFLYHVKFRFKIILYIVCLFFVSYYLYYNTVSFPQSIDGYNVSEKFRVF